jgi:hypothetical protein
MSNQGGESHVVDNCGNTHNSMAAGAGDRLYDGLFYSHPARCCHHRRADTDYSGTKNIVAIWTLAGEGGVFGEEVVSRSRKILPKLAALSGEKVLQPIIETKTYGEE